MYSRTYDKTDGFFLAGIQHYSSYNIYVKMN